MIKLNNITKIYTGNSIPFTALNAIDLTIKKGDFTTISGASGSGKSTLLNIVGLLDGYDEGTYILGEQDISSLSTKELAKIRLTRFGFIFQSFHLINHLTAVENVELPLGYSGISASIRRSKAIEMLDRVGLGDKLKNRPTELSGGEQQRVAIARALVNSPELILADEPTGNLDSATSQRIIELLRSLNDDGITIMLVTHDREIINDSVKVITMSDGEISGTSK